MAYSYVRYTGNGSTQNYTFSFPYINQNHIKVRVNGVITTAWSFLNASTVQFSVAPANGAILEIRRETPKDSAIVNFTDGSVLLERDLDLLATYDLYLAQETQDSVDSTISQTSTGVFDALSKRIVNLADPVSAQDAATKAYADTVITLATTQANAAAISASSASASAIGAANSAAAAAAALDNFDDRYLGQKSNDPAVDNDGNPLLTGALYYNTANGVMRVYTGTAWINASSAQVATMKTFVFVATAGQTVFSGNDTGGSSLTFVAPYIIVSMNGVELRPTVDYTMSGGSTITLTSAASVGDELQIQAFSNFNVANIQSANVSVSNGATGAVTRSVDQKLGETISVKDFGAVGDGVADDTAAIQNALNYLATTGYTGYAGNTLYFPAGKYLISSTLKPAMSDGVANIKLIGAGTTNTIIEWVGPTDLTKAMFGLYAADIGTVTNSLFEGIRWKGKGKVGYIFLFETTSTSTGAARRENENNMYNQIWFEGAKRALVMFGDYSIDTNAAYLATGNDINVNANTFDNCVFLNFENYALKQVGGNIYNTVLRNCFMWAGNNTDVTSANAKNYIFSVSAGMTVIEGGCFQKLVNTGANNGTDKIACMRGAFADFHLYGAQSEDARLFYHNTEGSPDRPQDINGVYVNDSRAMNDGAYAIYNEGSSPLNISACSFGHLSATDNYRNIYSAGAVHWNSSVTSKQTSTKMILSSATYAAQSTFNGKSFDKSRPLNKNWAMNSWAVPAATFRNATTNDYYLNEFAKSFGTGAQGTLTQVNSVGLGKTIPRLNCTTVGTTFGLRLGIRDNFDLTPYRNSKVWVIVSGQHDGSYSTNAQMGIRVTTDSVGGSSSDVLYDTGSYFVAYYKQEVSASATYLSAEFNNKKVGHVDLLNFMIVPDEFGIEAGVYAIGQYTRGDTAKIPVVFEANGLSEAFQSASQTYTDTLSDYENAVYFVAANFNDTGSETAIVLAHRFGANAYVSKVSSLNSGTGASITASAVGAVVSIAINGTSLAYVKKLKLADL